MIDIVIGQSLAGHAVAARIIEGQPECDLSEFLKLVVWERTRLLPRAASAGQDPGVLMNGQMYQMCELTKPVDGGVARMVSWIRAEIAIPGRQLRGLEDTDTGRIESGWTVESVARPAYPENVLLRDARDWRKQRGASDI